MVPSFLELSFDWPNRGRAAGGATIEAAICGSSAHASHAPKFLPSLLSRFRFLSLRMSGLCADAGFADAAHYGLRQAVDALFLGGIHSAEAEFGLVLRAFAEVDGHLAAEIIFDEGGFVAGALLVPGVNAQDGEVARLAFGVARSGNQVLRLNSRGRGDAVQLEPGNGAHVGG